MWNFKPEWLQFVIKRDEEQHIISGKHVMDPFLHKFTFLARRDHDGKNIQAFSTTKKGAPIYENVLFAIVDNKMSHAELVKKIECFGIFATSTLLQKCLMETARIHVENKNLLMIESYAPAYEGKPNSFYPKFITASSNISLVTDAALDEMFLDDDVFKFVSLMFNVSTDSSSWEEYMYATAFKANKMENAKMVDTENNA